MRETRISLPELALLAGTRAIFGAGVGLLFANRLSEDQRRAAGWALVTIGALTTIPLAFEVLGGGRVASSGERSDRSNRAAADADGRPAERESFVGVLGPK